MLLFLVMTLVDLLLITVERNESESRRSTAYADGAVDFWTSRHSIQATRRAWSLTRESTISSHLLSHQEDVIPGAQFLQKVPDIGMTCPMINGQFFQKQFVRLCTDILVNGYLTTHFYLLIAYICNTFCYLNELFISYSLDFV